MSSSRGSGPPLRLRQERLPRFHGGRCGFDLPLAVGGAEPSLRPTPRWGCLKLRTACWTRGWRPGQPLWTSHGELANTGFSLGVTFSGKLLLEFLTSEYIPVPEGCRFDFLMVFMWWFLALGAACSDAVKTGILGLWLGELSSRLQ